MKNERQNKILEIIGDTAPCTQSELINALKRAGINTTQATVSRDIHDLRIVKELDKSGRYRYTADAKQKADAEINCKEILANSVLRVYHALNDVIVKCHPGMAQGACTVIDKLFSDLALGTLAGDDTILAVTKSGKDSELLSKKICEML